jgi:hypothetical protein
MEEKRSHKQCAAPRNPPDRPAKNRPVDLTSYRMFRVGIFQSVREPLTESIIQP